MNSTCAQEGCDATIEWAPPYCAVHTRGVLGLEVKPSGQGESSGLGLYAVRGFQGPGKSGRRVGAGIVEYRGLLRRASDLTSDEARYSVQLNKEWVRDGSDVAHATVGRFANTGRQPSASREKGKRTRNNCRFCVHQQRVMMRATRPIAAGEEILAAYGSQFKI